MWLRDYGYLGNAWVRPTGSLPLVPCGRRRAPKVQNYTLGTAIGIHGKITARKSLRTYYLYSSAVSSYRGRDFSYLMRLEPPIIIPHRRERMVTPGQASLPRIIVSSLRSTSHCGRLDLQRLDSRIAHFPLPTSRPALSALSASALGRLEGRRHSSGQTHDRTSTMTVRPPWSTVHVSRHMSRSGLPFDSTLDVALR
jgi:hypothetical protein